uniref:Tubulin/FtsZ 2-layer sandwich domain-containing protein n=3 Tax=Dendroctonus ponderosae TaxID=77166 RepID=A0AAR5QG15_DENPD
MNEINTNMVPFPKMSFLSSSFNHLVTANSKISSKRLKEELFFACCNRSNQLVQVDPLGPKSVLLASTLIGRGEYSTADLQGYIGKLQAKGRFTSWSKKAVKMGLCNVPPNGQNVALFSLFNTTGMFGLFQHIAKQFSSLFRKQAHIHHYTNVSSFEMDFFDECLESLRDVMHKYKSLENVGPQTIPRLEPRSCD